MVTSFEKDNVDKDPSQILKRQDVDDWLDHPVEEGKGKCDVEQLGRVLDRLIGAVGGVVEQLGRVLVDAAGGVGGNVESRVGENKAEGRDGDEKETGDHHRLLRHPFQSPEILHDVLRNQKIDDLFLSPAGLVACWIHDIMVHHESPDEHNL